jgi:hypothetical protein
VLEKLAASVKSTGTPARLVLCGFAIALAVGSWWGLPGSHTWSADSISPRSCGLGAIAETYRPGHFHTYPPLHMALLTLLSLPWMALGASRVGGHLDALGLELIKPLYMTGIEAGARAVAGAMALGIVWNTMRLWTRLAGERAGLLAAITVASNATLVYYAHTGNLEVPYLFWISWALVELDRTLAGETRERPLLVVAALAVLTKDQAAAVLVLPLSMAIAVAIRRGGGGSRERTAELRRWATGGAVAAALYAVVSGALVNLSGFERRLAFLLGPASATWARYPRGAGGALALLGDAVRMTPHFTSWPVAGAAVAGAVLAIASPRTDRVRVAVPLVAALSFTIFFNLGARRAEDRFLLPQSLLLLPYGAIAFDRAWSSWPRARAVLALAGAASLVPALLGVASIDATLLADPRYAAERFLAALPAGTRVEVYGGPIFLPRIPAQLVVSRPGVEPFADRQSIDGIDEILDPAMDPRPRAPEVIVLSTELSVPEVTEPPESTSPYGLMSYRDAATHRMLRGLLDGSLGYTRAAVFGCALLWPLECRSIHDSTAGHVWIYSTHPVTDR